MLFSTIYAIICSVMRYLETVAACLLLTTCFSLTFNLDETASSNPTVLIFRKSKPSILIFPSNQTLTLNYPHSRQYTKIQLAGNQPTIDFGSLGESSKKQQKPAGNQNKTKSAGKVDSHGQKQGSAQKEGVGKTKTEQIQRPPKYPSLSGTYGLLHSESFNLSYMMPIKFNRTHVSYTACSENSCMYSQDKGSIQFGSCQLLPITQCPPFGQLFYADMRLLAQLQLLQTFKFEEGKYKFYDKQPYLRIELKQIK